MLRTPIIWMLMAGLWHAAAPLQAEPHKQTATSAVEFSQDGLPIIKVVLHTHPSSGRSRTCRFLVNTGHEHTIIDHSVPTEYFQEEQGAAAYQDATGTAHPMPTVRVNRIEVPGLVRDGVAACRADLKRTGSPDDDEPVDGILGMSFLKGTRFLFDPADRHIQWGQDPAPGVTLPLVYSANQLPLVTLRVGTTPVSTLVHLGVMGGLYLPWSLKPAGEGVVGYSQGMLGQAKRGQDQELGRVEAGAGAWTNVLVSFCEGVEGGRIGQDVWSAAPVGFDFIQDRLTLQVDRAGRLPIRDRPRITLPVLWDRTGPSPRLVVVAVKPGSPLAKAGCRPEDELIRAGNLSGRTLNRRNLMALMGRGETHAWTVRRGGKLEKLVMFGPAQGE